MRICTRCKAEKGESEFHRVKRGDGRDTICSECRRAYMRQYLADPERKQRHRRSGKDWRDKNLERSLELERERYHRNPERFALASRKWLLKSKYGLTLEQYDQMLAGQGGGCAICGSSENSPNMPGKSLAVDHDHKTGKIRGLLCDRCNRAVGWFKDDHEVFLQAALYIERHKE